MVEPAVVDLLVWAELASRDRRVRRSHAPSRWTDAAGRAPLGSIDMGLCPWSSGVCLPLTERFRRSPSVSHGLGGIRLVVPGRQGRGSISVVGSVRAPLCDGKCCHRQLGFPVQRHFCDSPVGVSRLAGAPRRCRRPPPSHGVRTLWPGGDGRDVAGVPPARPARSSGILSS
jgi:hypothetical protein